MKKITLILSFAILFVKCSPSQDFGLSKKRIENIKLATVKIVVNNGVSIGTGFIINDNKIITCLHVVESLLNTPNGACKAIFSSGEEVPLKPSPLDNNASMLDSMIIYDFYVLEFATDPKTKFSHLSLGGWGDILEGNLTYTCGYPIGIDQQIVSVGIMSTKYTKPLTMPYKDPSKGTFTTIRNEGWMDMTINNGNSGGALIKVGRTPEEDRVVGIVDFKLAPYADTTQKLINILNAVTTSEASVRLMGVDPNETSLLFAKAIKTMSLGVSGCISIEYLKRVLGNN
jgi:S1-C subfamily serine protease